MCQALLEIMKPEICMITEKAVRETADRVAKETADRVAKIGRASCWERVLYGV